MCRFYFRIFILLGLLDIFSKPFYCTLHGCQHITRENNHPWKSENVCFGPTV